MKTLTRDEAMTELANLPGWCDLTARNVLFETTKSPYVVVDDALFIAATGDSRFLLADVQRTACCCGDHQETDGAAFATLLNEAKAAGAERVGTRSPLPGWC